MPSTFVGSWVWRVLKALAVVFLVAASAASVVVLVARADSPPDLSKAFKDPNVLTDEGKAKFAERVRKVLPEGASGVTPAGNGWYTFRLKTGGEWRSFLCRCSCDRRGDPCVVAVTELSDKEPSK